MKQTRECPFCEGTAILQKQLVDYNYRKEAFAVYEHFYKCEKCNEEYTTTESDTLTVIQAQNQYREKYSIPFTDEICAIRSKYDLSAAKMSEVLGLGTNGYGNYEKGEIPTPAIGNLIRTAEDPKIFLSFIENSKSSFSPKQFQEAIENVEHLILKESIDKQFDCKINLYTKPNNFTGFKKPKFQIISNLLVKLISSCKPEYNDKLKINKLLFYCDFLHYKSFGFSITGLSYRSIQFGPVPSYYANIFSLCEAENIISSTWERESSGSGKELLLAETKAEESVFSKEQSETIEFLINKFKNTSSWDLVDLSHREIAWQETHQKKDLINYQDFAFKLNAI